jgi:hypothetical protein
MISRVLRDTSKKDRIFGLFSEMPWRSREAVTGLACSIHSGEQLGPTAEMGLR